ncbi:flagellar biosynthesis protein FlgE [Pseudoroseomonas rhizosphaerae]|uniref:Flagellar hook protein FlgE n=1 Tax=Teichococcus rhizosphaerae TaxID=1335062 RepID=A0A2C7A7U0_9PROT|nr:flagellar hook-basal body complex protein [Pseudoroseomonas rhizosphaerae]PHK93693.1 flagellar biosynthesis protein FlgE [Pseudoroseomonas rhizosphaerae]
MTAINALRTSTSGLNAQATKLSGISNNIANSSTVGYKRVDTQFESLVLEGSSGGAYAMAGTAAKNRVEISKVGQVQATGTDTDIAVNGNGFLVVNEEAGSGGKYLATRAGSFRPDAMGNLVNSAGYYLQGVKLGSDGNPVGVAGDNNVESLSTVNVNNISVASAPTTEMRFWVNLPKQRTEHTTSPGELDNMFVTNVDYYDDTGGAQTLTYRFTPTLPATAAGAATSTWQLEIFDSASGDIASTDPYDKSKRVGLVGLEFWKEGDKAGTIANVFDGANNPDPNDGTPYAPGLAGVLDDPQLRGTSAPGAALGDYNTANGTLTVKVGIPSGSGLAGRELPITLGNLGSFEGMTQLSGNYVPTKIEKDGSAFGLLERVSVSDEGQVIATFSNGKSRPIYNLKLAVFPNANGLNPVRGDAYEMSLDAGSVRLLDPGSGAAGTTSGGALESSNVDIGTELTNLIETQRAYSSNASVVRTADQMMEEAANLKR